MIPPGEALHIKGDSGRQASLLCYLDREAIKASFGIVDPEMDTVTYAELQQRRELIRKRLGGGN